MTSVVRCDQCGSPCAIPAANSTATIDCPHCNRSVVPSPGRSETPVLAVVSRTPVAPPAAPDPLFLPARLGRFEVRSVLGRGAFGIVYRAYDPSADREVALKVPLPGMLEDPARRERFL